MFYLHLKSMLNNPEIAKKAIPREYRNTALGLFPEDGFSNGKEPSINQILSFGKILGLGKDNKRFLSILESPDELEKLLHSFQNNLDLLIQKTWVDKTEESRKENLLDRLPAFISMISEEKYFEALEEFGAILEELSWLFFGAQSQKDDFTEYTFRIDNEIGLFWWYGNQLSSDNVKEWIKRMNNNILKAILLLGIFYLTNF